MLRFSRQFSGSADVKSRAFSLPALVSLVLAAAFLFFLVTRFDVDFGITWSQLKGSNPWLLTAAVLVHYTTFIFRGARWRVFLQNTQIQEDENTPPQKVPGVLYCSQLVLLGWFANAIGWLRLGDAYRAYLYREEQNASFSRTIGTILAERVVDTILVVGLLIVVVPFLLDRDGGAAWMVLAVAISLTVGLVFLLAAIAWGRELVLRMLPSWLGERFIRFHQGTLGSFRRLIPVTILGLLGWMAEVGRLYLVVQALDLDIGFPLVVFLTLANSLLTLVPTPGGFGAVESGVAGLVVRFSTLSGSIAAALVLVDRAITYLSIIVVGAILFISRQAFRRRSVRFR
jgi:uncharacterized protein (TIRG00374 family)